MKDLNAYVAKFYKAPEEVLDAHNLVYTTPEILTITRKKIKDTTVYLKGETPYKERQTLDRIKKLVLPPAWSQVRIAELENAHLQATGRDAKKRKQYRYHEKWLKLRKQTKFYKMLAFAEKLPQIRKHSKEDLERKNWSKEKVLALVVRLLEESHIRVGNACYAKQNKTYGLSTLRNRHVSIVKDKIKFNFIGKRGKEHNITIKNKKLAKLVNQCEEIPGWELFQYFDENGEKQKIDSGMVNAYIQNISGAIFSAKDFRTWAASLIVFDFLKQLPTVHSQKKKEENWSQAVAAAAKELNNTKNVCKNYYVHPLIKEVYLNDAILTYFKMVDAFQKPTDNGLQPNEKALKALLEKYRPQELLDQCS